MTGKSKNDKSLSMFDPDFARSFVDGRFYENFNHEEALKKSSCPILLIHCDWNRSEKYGLIGALDDNDARKVIEIAPQTIYRKYHANHVLHAFKPKEFTQELVNFKSQLSI